MGGWIKFPLPDGSYSDSTRPFTQQDVVNLLPTFAEGQGALTEVVHKPAPGLAHFTHVGAGPHRGARDVEGKAFIVSGRKLYQVAVDGTATEIGTIPGTAKVSMTHNQISGGNQLVIATGDNSYVYNTVTEVLAATGVPLVCVDFLNQRILGVDQARRFWRYSGVATATSWEELDNESAESSPDRIVGGIVSQGEWLVFGERTIEVFSNSPNEATAFVRSQVIEKGCANANTICRLDNSVMWVGNDGIPYRLNGYTPVPIASKAIIDTISSGNPRKLSAFTWEDKGYVCYYVTAQDGYTFGYDVSSGKWHRRESYGFDRWRINTLFKWNNAWYAGDFQNGRMYRLEWGYVYEGCEIMPRKIRTGVMHNNGNRVTLHGFRLDVATGGPASEPDCPDAPPTPEDERFIGAGVTTAGEIATTRTFDASAVVMGTDDANVGAVTTSAVLDVAVIGSSVFAMVSGGGTNAIYQADRSDLTAWTNVATPSLSIGTSRIAAAGANIFVTSGTVLSKWDGTTLTTTNFGTTLMGAAGDADVLFVVGASGSIWRSTDGGGSFTLIHTYTASIFSVAYNGSRVVVARSSGSGPRAIYSDNLGAAWSDAGVISSGATLQPFGLTWCGANNWLVSCAGSTGTEFFFRSTDNLASFSAVAFAEDIRHAYPGSAAYDAVSGRTVAIGTNATSQRHAYSSTDLSAWSVVDLSDTVSRSIFSLYPQTGP